MENTAISHATSRRYFAAFMSSLPLSAMAVVTMHINPHKSGLHKIPSKDHWLEDIFHFCRLVVLRQLDNPESFIYVVTRRLTRARLAAPGEGERCCSVEVC